MTEPAFQPGANPRPAPARLAARQSRDNENTPQVSIPTPSPPPSMRFASGDLLRTMTKFLALGLTLPRIITATTDPPAQPVNRPDLGNLKTGSTGDASTLILTDTPILRKDMLGQTLTHPRHVWHLA